MIPHPHLLTQLPTWEESIAKRLLPSPGRPSFPLGLEHFLTAREAGTFTGWF